MYKGFYNRTAYRFVQAKVPQCFLQLEEFYADTASRANIAFGDTKSWRTAYIEYAENLCGRMADLEFYQESIRVSIEFGNAFLGAIKARTFMVGYFSSCKSTLDAAAITITRLYALPLSFKEQDFSKKKFWEELKDRNSDLFERYKPFRSFTCEVVRSRDAAVHRFAPLLVVHSPGDPSETSRSLQEIKMTSKDDATLCEAVQSVGNSHWEDPLRYPEKWHPMFDSLCAKVCKEIQKTVSQETGCID